MSNVAIVGMGYGDEGKGVVTEYLASQDPENTIVVRFSGGQQAGHKVIKGDVEHVFSNFGAGTLSGCPTYWSKHCTFDPYSFAREWNILLDKGVVPQIYIHPDCPVTTPYDVYANRQGVEKEHGTTGTGFGRTIKREKDGVRFHVEDLFHVDSNRYFMDVQNYYDPEGNIGGGKYFDMRNSFDGAISFLKDALGRQLVITDKLPNLKHKVFEGSQGLMLHEHIGTMPHCTPSDVTPRKAMEMADIDEVFLVTRAYQTRHGNGPMTNKEYPVVPVNNEKETNVCNEWQGEFRSTVLDLDTMVYAKNRGVDGMVPIDTKVSLVVTCMDQISEYRLTRSDNGGIGRHRTFFKADDFVRRIGSALNINGDLYVNNSPYSDTIRKLTP